MESRMDGLPSTEDTQSLILTTLTSAQSTWDVRSCATANPEDVVKIVSGIGAPGAIVVYEGSRLGWGAGEPRRTLTFSVMLLARGNGFEKGGANVRKMLDDTMSAVDGLINGLICLKVSEDKIVDLGVGISSINLTVTAEVA